MAEKEKKKREQPEEIPASEEVVAGENETAEKTPAQDEAETVTIPLKEFASQLEELDTLKKQADEFSDGWQRERAEFANYRKRAARDDDMNRQNSRIDILRKYLDIHDDIELAIKNMPASVKNDGWANGIQLIYQKLSNLLKGEGLEPIPDGDGVFNPELHEAISHEDNPDFDSGKIIEIVQQGYQIGERVVRPSRVRVAK
ncbi:MAG TPA: nucleotide exchange factor GrpE [Pelolinea sp.]|nr:nucleotide exchange factor GrpE [Pelolinea sp.]